MPTKTIYSIVFIRRKQNPIIWGTYADAREAWAEMDAMVSYCKKQKIEQHLCCSEVK